jgi:hypothetical protein
MKCMACGVEKALEASEAYPFPGRMCNESISPLLAIECEGDGGFGSDSPFKVVVVCHQCFEKLDPDMWIGEKCWRSLNPVTPYEELPLVKKETVLIAENYG